MQCTVCISVSISACFNNFTCDGSFEEESSLSTYSEALEASSGEVLQHMAQLMVLFIKLSTYVKLLAVQSKSCLILWLSFQSVVLWMEDFAGCEIGGSHSQVFSVVML